MAAQDAELQLKVGLDLAFFRQQLLALGQASAGYQVPVDFKFDRSAIVQQFRVLQRYFSTKTFNVRVESTTLETLAIKAAKLKEAIASLDGTSATVQIKAEAAALSKKDINAIRTNLVKQISAEPIRVPISARVDLPQRPRKDPIEGRVYASQIRAQLQDAIAGRDGIVRVPVTVSAAVKTETGQIDGAAARDSIKKSILGGAVSLLVPLDVIPAITAENVAAFKKEVEAKFSGITVKIKADIETNFASSQLGLAGLQKYMKEQGLSGGNVPSAQGAQVGAASMARRTLFEDVISKATAKEMKGMLSTAEVAGRSGLKTKEQMQARLLELDDILMERILGSLKMQMSEPPRKVGRSFLDQVARAVFWMAGVDPEYLRRQAAQRKALPPVDFPAVLPRRRIEIGPSSTGRALPPAPPTSAGMIAGARPPIGLLPEITARGQLQATMGALISGLQRRELPGQGGALAVPPDRVREQALEALQQQLDQMLRIVEVSVKETSAGLQKSLDVFSYFVQSLRGAEKRAENATRILRQSKFDAAVSSFLKGLETIVRLAEARLRIAQVRVGDMGTRAQRAIGPAQERLMLPAQTSGRPFRESTSSPYSTGPISNRGEVYYDYLERRGREARRRSDERSARVLQETGGASGGMGAGVYQFTRPISSALVHQPRGALAALPQPMAPPPQPPISAARFGELRQMASQLRVAREHVRGLTADQVPLVGGLVNLAREFKTATGQLILYGTAYRALAFIQSLPRQILDATKQQQQYTNAMQSVTEQSGTFAKEMLFVDNVQRAFGLNLETTRNGFIKLFASMSPSGFDSGSIEKLFVGISSATAALQLTPDKAERVIYAFGQMASKGQVMSEELKGQLGDVLPGALSIFAKAAGKSVEVFSKELEDGVYKGQAFRGLMTKVTDELITRFGTGAQAAGKSLQGLMNTVQADFSRTLGSFAPLADAAAKAVLIPLGNALKQTSYAAQIAFGEMDRLALQIDDAKKVASDLKVGGADASQIRAAEQNVAALQARYNQLNLALKDPAVQEQANNLLRFTQELAKAGTFVLNLASTLGSIFSYALNLVGGNLTAVIGTLTALTIGFQAARLAATVAMGVFVLFRSITVAMGLGTAAKQAMALAQAFNVLGISATGATVKTVGLTTALRVLAGATVFGVAITGILALAGAFMTMSDSAAQAAQSARDAGKAAAEAAVAGNVPQATASYQNIRAQTRSLRTGMETLRDIYKRNDPGKYQGRRARPNDGFVELSALEAVRLQDPFFKDLMGESRYVGGRRQIRVPTENQMREYERRAGQQSGVLAQEERQAAVSVQEAERVSAQTGQAVPTPGPAVPAGESDADRKKREKAEKEAEAERKKQQAAQETLARQTQQYIVENAELENKLTEIEFQHATDLADEEYRHRKELQDLLHQGELSGLDEIQARARKLGQELERIDMERIEAVRKAREKIDEAAMKVANARRTAAAAAEAATAAALPSQLAGPSQRLAALIGGPESYGGNYGAFNRGGRGNNPRGSGIDPNLTSMTIAEILQRQQLPMGDPQRFHAVGKYQIIHDTLKELLRGVAYGPTGVTAASQFDQPTQDALFMALAKARHVPGKPEETVRGWRQEWTGLSKVDTAKLLEVARAFDAAFTQASAAAANLAPALTAPSGSVLPPVRARKGQMFQGFPVTSDTQAGRDYGRHEGVDIAMPEGTSISYSIPGRVLKVDKVGLSKLGKSVEVELANGVIGLSGHLSEVLVEVGQLFDANQIIAKSGMSGRATGPHLHQESAPYAYKTGQEGASLAYIQLGKPGAQASGSGAPVLGQSSRVFAMQRTAQQGKADLEEAQARQRVVNSLEQVKVVNALEKAYASMAATIKTEIDTLFPVRQQQLENRLLSLRLDLLRKNMPEEFVNYLIEASKASDANTLIIEETGRAYARLSAERQRYLDIQASGVKLTPIEEQSLSAINKMMTKNTELAQEAAAREAESRMEMLQGVIATMKHADAMKKLQEAYEAITSTISDVTGLYKTFFKEVATGTSALEAMQKVQQGLADKTLTMFIDFAMKPMEDFFKKEMLRIFNIPDEEAMRKAALAAAEQQLQELKTANTYLRSIAGQAPGASGVAVPSGTQPPVAPSVPPALPGSGVTQQPMAGMNAFSSQGQPGAPYPPPGTPNFNATGAGLTALSQANNEYSAALSGVTGSIGSAGKSVGTEGSKFAESLGKTVQGVGMAAVSIMSIAAGFSQIKEGGISGVLGGIGSILVGVGGAIGGFSGLFKAPAAAANGAVWKGGFTAFADGGVVRGPTLGLIGEGKYSEAIVPLPDGKSIPVKMGRSSSREMLSSGQRQAAPTVLSMNFQTTKFGSTEYVDVDQLQAAMAETRRLAAKDGATRGASLALDRLQNSPSARRKVGIG